MASYFNHLVWIFFFLCFSLAAQESKVQTGDILYNINAGFNYSKIHLENREVDQLARPFLGLNGSLLLSEKWRMNSSALVSMKASKINSTNNIQQLGFNFLLYPQYKWDDFYFNGGLIVDVPFNSRLQSSSGSGSSALNTIVKEEIPSPKTQLNILLGFEFKVVENWKLAANFHLPSRQGNSRNFQLSVIYQINKRAAKPENARKIRKRITTRQIRQLKNGALLVRLKTSIPKIEAMKKMGMAQEAEEVAKNQKIENFSLMKSMKAYYDFSEVRFFYSYDSKKVRKGRFKGIFLNDSLKVDSNIVLRNKKNIFTAEFALLEQDTSKFFSHYEWVQTGHFAFVREPRYYGGGGNTFMALVLRDQDFKQLHRPFPYYSRALFKAMKDHPGHGFFYFPVRFFSSGSYRECIQNLNEKLWRFYEKTNEK